MRILVLTIIFSSLLVNIAFTEEFNLRKTRWGMTKQQVISSEKNLKPVVNTNDEISYETSIADIDFILYYRFKQGKLVNAAYNTTEHYNNSYKHVEEYAFLQDILTGKYGEPINEIAQVPDEYKENEQKLGLAAKKGLMKLNSQWQTSSTLISLELKSSDKEKLSNSIIYIKK